jgi:hypothetical protein
MSITQQKIGIDVLVEPLVEAIMDALERRPEFHAMVQALMVAERQAHPLSDEKRLYSIDDLRRRYGVGRTVALRDIRSGRLQATERRCRGGRIGNFITVEEAERVYARFAGQV